MSLFPGQALRAAGRWSGLVLVAVLAGCARAGPAATATLSPTRPPSPTPAASATATPHLLLVGAEDEPLIGELTAWAAVRGWGVSTADPEGAGALLDEARPDVQAIVSFGDPFGGQAAEIAQQVAPLVLVEAEGIAPGPRLSTVGEPGGRHDQAGFLAGVMVGLGGRTGWVGLVEGTGGRLEGPYRGGFEAGLRFGCPKCRLVALPAEQASVERFRGQGVEFVFILPGPAAPEAAGRLVDPALWLVWVGERPADGPAIAGRVAFSLDGLIPPALEALLSGESGAAWPFAVENGGIRLEELDPRALSAGRQRLLLEAYQALAAGELEIGVDPTTGEEGSA